MFDYMINDCEVVSFSGTPTQLAEVVKGGDVSCIHSLRKTYFAQGVGRTFGTLQTRDCFFAPPITDTISSLNSARTDLAQADSQHPLTLERLRDTVAASYRACAPSDTCTAADVDGGLGYWMDLRGVWWSTETQDGDRDERLKIDWKTLVGKDGSAMTGGWIVPNHDKRPELKPLREKDMYCEGSSNREKFWGEGDKFKFYSLDTTIGQARQLDAEKVIDEESDPAEIQKMKKSQELLAAKEFEDFTTPWTDKLRYKLKLPSEIPASFAPDAHEGDKFELAFPFAMWNEGDLWLDQCELTTVEVDSTGKWMMWGNEPALHLPIGGMETTTWRNVGTGYETLRAARKELVEPSLAATYDLCPHYAATLGAAMGWVVLLEAAATILFLAILMPCGIVKNDKASFKALISQVLTGMGSQVLKQVGEGVDEEGSGGESGDESGDEDEEGSGDEDGDEDGGRKRRK